MGTGRFEQDSGPTGGLPGQPAPKPDLWRRVRRAALGVLGAGDPAKERTSLYLAFEEGAFTNLVGAIADCLGEDTVYRGVVSILEEAVDSPPTPGDRRFAVFNLARVHVARAALQSDPVRRRAPLASASAALSSLGPPAREVAWIDLQGEVESLRGNVAVAISHFERLTAITGNPAVAATRVAETLRRAGRLDEATAMVEKGLRADKDGRRWRHRLYQLLGMIEVDRGRIGEAEACLKRSTDVVQDSAEPWAFQTGLAIALLRRGRIAAVKAYADAAEKHLPGDPDAADLRARVAGGKA